MSHFLLFLLSLLVLASADDDEGCRPGNVRNLKLNGTSHLTWDPPLNENCGIMHYLVLVNLQYSDEEWTYTVTERMVDVSHLTICSRYYFQVSQVSTDNVTGSSTTMNEVTPPPSDANLALESVRLTPLGTNVRIDFYMPKEFLRCPQRYRLVMYNDYTDASTTIYMSSRWISILGLTPCGTYTFSVRALFTLVEEGPATVVKYVASAVPTSIPTLYDISLGSSSANLTLGLQSLEQNRCPVNSVIINADPYFKSTFHIQEQESRDIFAVRLTGLDADSLYLLRIYTKNAAGYSERLLLAVQT